jgi:hypothetical protein
MSRPLAILLLGTLALLPCIGHAQSGENGDNPPRTQQDIIRDRDRACRGLKGEAYSECVSNYVGSRRDHPASSGWTRPSKPPKSQGRT